MDIPVADINKTASNEDLHTMAWNHSMFPLFAIDMASGQLLDVNRASELLTGYGRAELIGMSYQLLFPENERSSLRTTLLTISTPAVLKDLYIQTKTMRLIPVEVSLATMFENQGSYQLIGSFRNLQTITDTEYELAAKKWELSAYASAALALSQASSAEELMQLVCDALTHEHRYVLAWVGIAENTADKRVRIAAGSGCSKNYLTDLSVSWAEDSPWGQGPTGLAIRSGLTQMMKDAETHPGFTPWSEKAKQENIRASVAVPFKYQHDQHGALTVYSSEPETFGKTMLELFEHLAGEIAHGLNKFAQNAVIDSERQQREAAQLNLSNALGAAIRAMAKTMENRDPYTSGHQDRVSVIACGIAQRLGWSSDRLQALQMAAVVHDIGKIAIPIEILTKPKRLSDAEFLLMSEHPYTGYTILKDIPFPWPVAEIVYQHHEKIDGSGYPRGLQGNEILPEARVLAIADIVEAMASYRPYRPALGIEKALHEIELLAGKQLDAEYVAICTRMFREENFALPLPDHL